MSRRPKIPESTTPETVEIKMNDVRVIKKYPNRRLYDTRISRYITLEEIRQLVLGNARFRVEDKQSGQDITRSILLQVIAEQEEGGNPIFSGDLLTHIIRLYGDPMQTSISRYLELSLQLFVEQHQHFIEQLKGLLGQATPHPMLRLKEIAERQRPIWRSVRSEFLKGLSRSKPARQPRDGVAGGPAGDTTPSGE
jgi:polyhydroxyalkanoate synthesis repressor PhaR